MKSIIVIIIVIIILCTVITTNRVIGTDWSVTIIIVVSVMLIHVGPDNIALAKF